MGFSHSLRGSGTGVEAIARTLPLGSVGYEAEANERGERLI
jgi:hypothetical protein